MRTLSSSVYFIKSYNIVDIETFYTRERERESRREKERERGGKQRQKEREREETDGEKG